jgi:trans-2,3-dihydro-3-hydroxyanthranilate isomerase
MRRLAFATMDVFTTRPLEGNPLAVFPDARGMTDAEMQAIAREFNLSETTFVLPGDPRADRERGVRTRIFTPREEMPFAGHPTLGTAAVLRERGWGDEVRLALNVGTIPVHFSDRTGRTFGEMSQVDPQFGQVHDRTSVAAAIGVAVEDLDENLPIQTVSTGNPVVIVPFRALDVLQSWAPRWDRMEEYLAETDARFFYAICRQTVASDATLHARMVFYGGDDPATGSAAGPAVAWMIAHGGLPAGTEIQIEQGLEARRPSRIFARADVADGKVTGVRVGGFFAPLALGELSLP